MDYEILYGVRGQIELFVISVTTSKPAIISSATTANAPNENDLCYNEKRTMNELGTFIVSIIPFVAVALLFVLLIDCYKHARNNRPLWLLAIFVFGLIGYGFFYFSKDREK
jgi:drug/metabolite transporter (DMT)-like permease